MGLFRKDALAVNGFNHDFIGWGREDTEFVVRLTRYGLLRKENPFRAICFHLWHKENSRDQLSKNDQILDAARQEGGYFARIGINTLNTED